MGKALRRMERDPMKIFMLTVEHLWCLPVACFPVIGSKCPFPRHAAFPGTFPVVASWHQERSCILLGDAVCPLSMCPGMHGPAAQAVCQVHQIPMSWPCMQHPRSPSSSHTLHLHACNLLAWDACLSINLFKKLSFFFSSECRLQTGLICRC